MPSGKIVLKDNLGEYHVSGGCLACYGRFDNQIDEAFEVLTGKLKKSLPKEQHPSSVGWKQVVREHVDHVTIKVPSIANDLTILDTSGEAHEKMSHVFHALANDSIWADAFLTKEWNEIDPDDDAVHMNPHVKAEFMISAMSVLRRTCQHWYGLQYKYMVEQGAAYEVSLFYAILATSGGVEDWSGDEQVMALGIFSKARLKAFLEGDLLPEGMDGSTYAQKLGYSQEILSQWTGGTHNDGSKITNDASWTHGIGGNPYSGQILSVTPEGMVGYINPDYLKEVMNGKKEHKADFPSDSGFCKILGIAGKSVTAEVIEGKFGKQLHFDIKSIIDTNAGLDFLNKEVLNNG